jgi:TetR/AcrR family transcriptional regulator, transcriptional repressor for nem operon
MARTKEFDRDVALEGALSAFREHGYNATSANILTNAMNIGRQSMYDTFGDKWQLYHAALQRYVDSESRAHLKALATGPKAIDGLHALIARVVEEAHLPCLGISSIIEFGSSHEEFNQLRQATGSMLQKSVAQRISEAQQQGDLSAALDASQAAAFLLANVAAIRLAGRGGATEDELQVLSHFVMKALY